MESEAGFSVRRRSRHEIEYTSGGRRLIIEVEPGEGLAVYLSSVRSWEPPHAHEGLSDEERRVIAERVAAALDFLGVPYFME